MESTGEGTDGGTSERDSAYYKDIWTYELELTEEIEILGNRGLFMEKKTAKKTQKAKKKKKEMEQPVDSILEVTEFDQYLFGMGTHYKIYEKLGAHLTERNGQEGVYFAVWAPNARQVSVAGDFNGWDTRTHIMERLEPLGIYALFVPGVLEHSRYKYGITRQDGSTVMKADPYAIHSEVRPATASVVEELGGYRWRDGSWMKARCGRS